MPDVILESTNDIRTCLSRCDWDVLLKQALFHRECFDKSTLKVHLQEILCHTGFNGLKKRKKKFSKKSQKKSQKKKKSKM